MSRERLWACTDARAQHLISPCWLHIGRQHSHVGSFRCQLHLAATSGSGNCQNRSSICTTGSSSSSSSSWHWQESLPQASGLLMTASRSFCCLGSAARLLYDSTSHGTSFTTAAWAGEQGMTRAAHTGSPSHLFGSTFQHSEMQLWQRAHPACSRGRQAAALSSTSDSAGPSDSGNRHGNSKAPATSDVSGNAAAPGPSKGQAQLDMQAVQSKARRLAPAVGIAAGVFGSWVRARKCPVGPAWVFAARLVGKESTRDCCWSEGEDDIQW